MIEFQFYLSDSTKLEYASEITELSQDEIEYIVGRFSKSARWQGELRGKIVVHMSGKIQIRKSFGNKLLWTKE